MDHINDIQNKLGIIFKNTNLLKQAFIHRSFLNETKQNLASNERLEFLGDSILSYLVSEHLYLKYPDHPEGELTNLRASIVKTTTLAEVAKQMNLGNFLFLSRGEEEGGGRNNPSILADTFEAFLGSIYLDQGIIPVQKILDTYLIPMLPKIIEEKSYKDAKSVFQETVQDETKTSPLYKVLQEKGPDHAKEFTIGVFVDNKLWGTGSGKSKHEAEEAAARDALEKWKRR